MTAARPDPGGANPADDVGATSPGPSGHRHTFANAEYDESEGVLRVKGVVIDVEPRPLRLLLELLRRPNEVVTKDELFESVWNGRATVDHVLANAVSKLRAALGEEAGARIVTVPRVGYRLNGPVLRVATTPARTELLAGQSVPGREAYVLERSLGDDSRSEVWLARHARLNQMRVFKFATDSASLAALKREYTLYRVLHKELGPRDDFARVLETQFQSSPYFMECEFGGTSLLKWAEESGRLAAMPLSERLFLFTQVAQAVAAAHSVGVLHKDLKPGNVLVAGEPGHWQVRLTDFGSGRLLKPERLAELKVTALGMTLAAEGSDGSRSGTYMYLAPELLGGHAPTTQSDVYSLGVMLWQMVAADLRCPMASGWQRAVQDPLLVEEITQATEGAPEARTASVATLVHSLQQMEPRRAERARREAETRAAAEARAQSQRARARRPWVLAGVAGLALGLVATAWMYLEAEAARTRAVDAQLQVQAVSDFLHQDVMESPDVLTSGGVKPLQLMTLMRQASRRAAERFKGQPQAEAVVRRRIADTYLRRAAVAEALSELRKARELLEAAKAFDTTEGLMVRFLSARALLWAQQKDRAQALLAEAVQLSGEVRIHEATELGSVAMRARLDFMLDAGEAKAAIPLAQRLVEQIDRIRSPQSPHRVDARQRLAEAYIRAGMENEAAEVFEQLANPPFNAPNMAGEYKARAVMFDANKLATNERYDEAIAMIRAARKLLGPEATANRFYLAWFEYWEGGYGLHQSRFEDARKSFESAMALFVECVGNDHVYVETMRKFTAVAALAAGNAAEAALMFDAVDRWYLANVNESGDAASRFGRVSALIDLGQAAQALTLLEAIPMPALARADQQPGLEARVAAERARALMALGRHGEAKSTLRQAVVDMKAAKVPRWQLARYERLL